MKKSIVLTMALLGIFSSNAQKINNTDLIVSDNIKQVNLTLTKGSEVTFSGFDKGVAEMIQPEFFSVTGNTTATFLGNNGEYTLYYADDVIYVGSPDKNFPEALWITGKGICHPKCNVENDWSMNPTEIFMCNRISDNVYRTMLRLNAGFDFKSFSRRNWDAGYGSNIFTPYPASSIEKAFWINGDTGNSHPTGDFISAGDFTPGVYTLEFDVAKGTCCLIELTGEDTPAEVYTVNGVAMVKDNSLPDYSVYSAELNLKKGETVEFGNIRHLQYLLQPEYFTKDGAGYKFAAPDGTYKISYANERELIYIERTDKIALDDDVLFLTGADFAHPASSAAFAEDVAGWGYDKPKDFVCCVTTAPGVYETNLYLKAGFMLRGYKDKGDGKWTSAVQPNGYAVLSEDGIGGRDSNENFGVSDPGKFTEGTYHIVFDKNNKTAKFSPLAPKDFYTTIPTGVNEVAAGERSIEAIYDLQGRLRTKSAAHEPGLYVIKYDDGSSSKMIVRK